jgi:WD40 repeat protein
MLAVGISRTAVQLVEASSGRELATLEAPEQLVINWIAFNPDGTQLAVALATGPIQLWDLRLIRQQLVSMNLDWGMPPYPRKKTNQPPGPLPASTPSPGTTTNAAMPR